MTTLECTNNCEECFARIRCPEINNVTGLEESFIEALNDLSASAFKLYVGACFAHTDKYTDLLTDLRKEFFDDDNVAFNVAVSELLHKTYASLVDENDNIVNYAALSNEFEIPANWKIVLVQCFEKGD